MIELRDNYWAVEVPDDAKNFRFGKSERLKNKLFYNTTLDYFAGSQVIEVGPGNWQIVCTSKDIIAGNELGIIDASEFISLLTSKGCDLNKTYLILKKQ